MNRNKAIVHIKIRRYDISAQPDIIQTYVELDTDSEYGAVKKKIEKICGVSAEDNKVIKIRREDQVLVPYNFLLEESQSSNEYFFVDVCEINYANGAAAENSLLQDAYVDSVHRKLKHMDSCITRAELLLPELECRRQVHMEEIVHGLSTKVSFLNRRIDDLLPAEWRSKMPQTIA